MPVPDENKHSFSVMQLPEEFDVIAPDGSEVRILHRLPGGSFAQFSLPPGQTAHAIVHRTVDEIWYFTGGEGEFWLKDGDREETVTVRPDVTLAIPVGIHFQFRNTGATPLTAIAVTMPPWPDTDDEVIFVQGPWG